MPLTSCFGMTCGERGGERTTNCGDIARIPLGVLGNGGDESGDVVEPLRGGALLRRQACIERDRFPCLQDPGTKILAQRS